MTHFTGSACWAKNSLKHAGPEHAALLREMLADEMRCPLSVPLDYGDGGQPLLREQPSCLHWSRQWEWPWAVLNAELTGKEVCLEAGCSWSVLKWALARRCGFVIGMDNDGESLAKARRAAQQSHPDENVIFLQGDITKMPSFYTNYFDRVMCLSVLEHTTDPLACVDELARVLKPGGLLLLTVDVFVDGPRPDHVVIDVDYANRIAEYVGVPLPPEAEISGGRLPGGDAYVVACWKLRKGL